MINNSVSRLFLRRICNRAESTTEHIDVDECRLNGKTALMLAVALNCQDSVDFLLKKNADISATDDNGVSALQMVLKSIETKPEIIEMFLHQIHNQCDETTVLVDRLFKAGCTLYHATFLGQIQLLEDLLNYGVDEINLTYCKGRSALHIATESNDLILVKWVLDHGANVNAVDQDGRTALLTATENRKSNIVELLLERGANPNVMTSTNKITPLIAALENPSKLVVRKYDECTKILLRYGAVPTNRVGDRYTVLDTLLNNNSSYRVNLLISHIVMCEMQCVFIDKTMMQGNSEKYRVELPKLQKFYEKCQQKLMTKVFQNLTLLDLLSVSERKFRSYMRRELCYEIVSKFLDDELHQESSRAFRYYYSILNDRLTKTPGIHLERQAISVICQIFRMNYNQCYVCAREIVEYLDKFDIQQLCEV